MPVVVPPQSKDMKDAAVQSEPLATTEIKQKVGPVFSASNGLEFFFSLSPDSYIYLNHMKTLCHNFATLISTDTQVHLISVYLYMCYRPEQLL